MYQQTSEFEIFSDIHTGTHKHNERIPTLSMIICGLLL